MITESFEHLRAAYDWIEDYPPVLREIMNRGDQSFDEFVNDLKDDIILNFLENDEVLAVCVGEEKEPGFYDIHFHSGRKLSGELTEKAVLGFRDALHLIEKVKYCSFSFPRIEKKIYRALIKANAVETGWNYYQPNGLLYFTMFWNAKA